MSVFGNLEFNQVPDGRRVVIAEHGLNLATLEVDIDAETELAVFTDRNFILESFCVKFMVKHLV